MERYRLWNEKILVAYSCGPDSTVLLHALATVCDAMRLSLVAAHIDHGIRLPCEGEADRRHAEWFAERIGVPLRIVSIPHGHIAEEAKRSGRSVEETARDRRHTELHRLMQDVECSCVAFGHTADDDVETIIMRLFQGSGIGGLKGIPEKRGHIIRPLIRCTRKDILAYVEEASLSFRTDPTNSREEYLRNRVRISLIPAIRTVFPGYSTGIAAIGEKMRLIEDYLEQETTGRLAWKRTATGYVLPLENFLAAHGALRIHSLYRMFNATVRGGPRRLPFRFLRPLLDDSYIANRNVLLSGYGLVLEKKGDKLFWQTDIVDDEEKGYCILVKKDCTYSIGENGIVITRKVEAGEEGLLDDASLDMLAVLRSRRVGDVIKTKTGTISLKKLFIDWKVPKEARLRIPVLQTRNGIQAVFGKTYGYKDIFSEELNREQRTGGIMRFFVFDNGV